MAEPLAWSYRAQGQDRKTIEGSLVAASERDVLVSLRQQNLLPLEIWPTHQKSLLGRFRMMPSMRLRGHDLNELVEGLADLLGAGVPLGEALSMLVAREKSPAIRAIIERLRGHVRSGMSLGDALEADPAEMPRLLVAMVRAGEATGTLSQQIERFATTHANSLALRRDLIGQTLYPAVLFVLVILTIVFLSFLVLPEFESIFADGQTRVPPETRMILDIGAWIRSHGWMAPIGFLGGALFLQLFVNAQRALCEQLLLAIPGIGPFVLRQQAARFCRGLGAMLEGGMSIVPALMIARQAVGFEVLRARYDIIIDQIKSGASFSAAVSDENVFGDEVTRFLQLGERTGDMGRMVSKSADQQERIIKAGLKRVMDLLSPVLTVAMGLVTAGVIGSVMSGVLSLNETVY